MLSPGALWHYGSCAIDPLLDCLFRVVAFQGVAAGEALLTQKFQPQVLPFGIDLDAVIFELFQKVREVLRSFFQHRVDDPAKLFLIRGLLFFAQPCAIVPAAGFRIFDD